MTAELMTVEVRSRRQWRAWLATHHTSSSGVWLVFYKHHTGLKSMPYEDAVREALCFGWIDSLIKRLDDDRYAEQNLELPIPHVFGSFWAKREHGDS